MVMFTFGRIVQTFYNLNPIPHLSEWIFITQSTLYSWIKKELKELLLLQRLFIMSTSMNSSIHYLLGLRQVLFWWLSHSITINFCLLLTNLEDWNFGTYKLPKNSKHTNGNILVLRLILMNPYKRLYVSAKINLSS